MFWKMEMLKIHLFCNDFYVLEVGDVENTFVFVMVILWKIGMLKINWCCNGVYVMETENVENNFVL